MNVIFWQNLLDELFTVVFQFCCSKFFEIRAFKKFNKWQQLFHYWKSIMTNRGMSLLPKGFQALMGLIAKLQKYCNKSAMIC
jgi:hypothetical protein